MNIFKTLASGSGSINEPNVSAFLGYLLNPKEDHGLGDAFLREFLKPLLIQNKQLKFMRNRDLSIRSNFEIEVLLEQAFRDDDDRDDDEKNRIVDIVILCYEKKTQQGRSLAQDIIKQKKEGQDNPSHIFLIENKIKDASVEDKQLEEQYKQTIDKLTGMDIDGAEDLVSVIFVTPEDVKAEAEFNNFKEADNNKKDNKYHLLWHKEKAKKSDVLISNIIKNILQKEYPPIDTYCKHTLQAFLEFIVGGFQSTINEELEKKGKSREDMSFEYKGGIYSRPKLAEIIIMEYIDDYEEKKGEKIDFDELITSDLFYKIPKSFFPTNISIEEIQKLNINKNRGDNWSYNTNLVKPIRDGEIRFSAGFDDKPLRQLLKNARVTKTLDEMRIK